MMHISMIFDLDACICDAGFFRLCDGGSLSVTEEKEKKKKDFYSSSIRLGFMIYLHDLIQLLSGHQHLVFAHLQVTL